MDKAYERLQEMLKREDPNPEETAAYALAVIAIELGRLRLLLAGEKFPFA